MPNTHRALPIQCPACQHVGCTLVVKSISIITGMCVNCGHQWATDILVLPRDIQIRVLDVLTESVSCQGIP